MAHRVMLRRWVPRDIEEIAVHLAGRSPDASARFLAAIHPTLTFLSHFPGAGSPKSFRLRVLANIRTWPVSGFPNHLIYYRVYNDQAIEVIAIMHGARRSIATLKGRM